jgi:hypothetical protein
MTTIQHDDRENLLAHEIDDLLLRARGLVLVRDLLAERGATRTEIEAHTAELARVRAQLLSALGGPPARARPRPDPGPRSRPTCTA